MTSVKAPVTSFNGVIAGVEFKNGSAETNDPRALAYFRRKGYEVSGTPKTTAKKAASSTSKK